MNKTDTHKGIQGLVGRESQRGRDIKDNNLKSTVTVMIKAVQGFGEHVASAHNYRKDFAEK